jgi:hypothetical protein
MPRDFLDSIEGVVQVRRAELAALNIGFAPQAKLAANLGASLFRAEHDHLNVRVQQSPALERVPLGHVNVTLERFRDGKKS